MMGSDDVLKQFYKLAPIVTDRFSAGQAVLSAVINASLDLVITIADTSKFVVGQSYAVSELTMLNPITNAVLNPTTGWTLTTANAHTLTTPNPLSDSENITLNSIWADKAQVKSIPSKTTIIVTTSEIASPVGAGLKETPQAAAGYLNLIAKNSTSNTLTFKLNEGYYYPCQCIVSKVYSRLNVAVVRDIERATQIYSTAILQPNELWAFIVMGDRVSVSNSDQIAGIVSESRGNVSNFRVSTEFTILVFWQAQGETESERVQINEAYDYVYRTVNAIYFGAKLGDSTFRTVPSGNGQSVSTRPNYVHAYEYQTIDIVDPWQDGVDINNTHYNVPVRNVVLDAFVSDGRTTKQSILNTVRV
jgi:hypothetical protein